MDRQIIDLFAGAGGLSLGAARAGFNVKAAVELDNHAIHTHIKNFPNSTHIQQDVSKLSGEDLLRLAGIKKGELDGLIGGPPCQGFSTIGKQQIDDNRNQLFNDFFRLVQEIEPNFFVAENVTGILNTKYDFIREEALSLVQDKYILLEPIKVKASEYGAPTIRTRIFFIGIHIKRFPKELKKTDFTPSNDLESINVSHALIGLPTLIQPLWLSEEQGWQLVDKTQFPKNRFFDRIINSIPNNIGNNKLIERYMEQDFVSGCQGTRHSKEVEERYANLQYGQQDKISKSVKLNPLGFCPTLRAGTGSDKGSYQAVRPIHYEQPRVITPREAARLQGFPDWFVFHETKWHSFRQIGNSVSPIVAEKILKVIFDAMNN
ncbi:DNA cytosine methyltransferase [Alkanindiges illinoisensis]|uniref:DNA cytosine methyltransferase n=1 Tax=Alkanindiges illinoisensis TaxID=197183 RepID=UPI00047E42BF|nr:DNA cytosine methyltransferase [Alkanindiges illinoisensis]